MPILLDTNILLRTQDVNTAGHAESVALLLSTYGRPTHPFVICAQVMIEFWVVATRPPDVNGLGLSPAEAGSRLDDLSVCVPCLPEPSNIGALWRDLMRESPVSGRPAHDAR